MDVLNGETQSTFLDTDFDFPLWSKKQITLEEE